MSIQNYSHKFDQQRSNNLSGKRSLPALHCFGEDPRRSSAATCQIGRISGLTVETFARSFRNRTLRLQTSSQTRSKRS